jgi:hypothetical protein
MDELRVRGLSASFGALLTSIVGTNDKKNIKKYL